MQRPAVTLATIVCLTLGCGEDSTGNNNPVPTPGNTEVEVVSDAEVFPLSLEAHDGVLLWGDFNGRAVRSFDPSTEEVATVVDTSGWVHDIAVGEDTVYWINEVDGGEGLWSQEPGGDPVFLDESADPICQRAVAVHGGEVYCGRANLVVRRTAGQNDPTVLCRDCGPNSGPRQTYAFANSRLYRAFDNTVGFVPLDTGVFEELHPEPDQAGTARVDDEHVYWLTGLWSDRSSDRWLRRMPLDGGEVEDVLGPLVGLTDYIIVEGKLYYVLEPNTATEEIWTRPLSGGEPARLAAVEEQGRSIAELEVLDGALYWIDSNGGRDGRLMRVRLP